MRGFQKDHRNRIRIVSLLLLSILLVSLGQFNLGSATVAAHPAHQLVSATTQVTASRNAAQAANVIDQNLTTSWSAGASAPQWIELDTGILGSISQIRLLVDQSPAGNTTHQIYAGATANPGTLVRQLSGSTATNTWLTATFSPPLSNVRYIRILTTQSPSWVAWREIELYGPTRNKIGVRQVGGRGEFYDTVTNRRFVPRGNNYIRLANQSDPWGGTQFYHSTFNVGLYNRNAASAALGKMKDDGYNIVRVLINDLAVGNPSGAGLSVDYLRNVADFLAVAQERKIYVILTFPFLPRTGGYYPTVNYPNIREENLFYMTQEYVDAKRRYLQDFITGIRNLNAPMDVIFSYNIENEAYYKETALPLTAGAGVVTTSNSGKSYNTADPAQRQQMMDENLVQWINKVRAGILQVAPGALVGVGFFSPKAVEGTADPRIIRTYWAIADASVGGSSADYIDLHVYAQGGSSTTELNSFEIPATRQKPLLLGEFGAKRSAYSSASAAALAVRDLQVQTCTGYGFSGWLLWTWDTTEQPEFYNALENGGSLNGILAPLLRPNPCAA